MSDATLATLERRSLLDPSLRAAVHRARMRAGRLSGVPCVAAETWLTAGCCDRDRPGCDGCRVRMPLLRRLRPGPLRGGATREVLAGPNDGSGCWYRAPSGTWFNTSPGGLGHTSQFPEWARGLTRWPEAPERAAIAGARAVLPTTRRHLRGCRYVGCPISDTADCRCATEARPDESARRAVEAAERGLSAAALRLVPSETLRTATQRALIEWALGEP